MNRVLVAALFVAALCPSARADEIVLKSGRSLAGTIVKEDDKRVIIKVRSGDVSIARGDIAEIRRGPVPAAKDPPPPAKKPDGAAAPAAAIPPAKPQDAKASTRGLLDEMKAIALVAWEHEAPSVVTESSLTTFKVVGTDGSSKQTYERPKSPEKVAALYTLSKTLDGRTVVKVDGEDQWYWNRLYWNDDEGMWTLLHPGESRFHRDCTLARRIADLCCKDATGRAAAGVDAMAIARIVQKDPAATAEKERAKLRDDCALATASKDAGELLAQMFELDVDIGAATTPAAKVALATKRRDVLKRLVDAIGG